MTRASLVPSFFLPLLKFTVSAFGARPLRQAICISMLTTRRVLNIKIIDTQHLQPSPHLTFCIFKAQKPPQWPMVRPYQEVAAIDIMMEVLDSTDHCQQLPAGHTILLLWLCQHTTVVSNYTLTATLDLKEYRPFPKSTGISVQDEVATVIRIGQYRRWSECPFQHLEGCLTFLSPSERCVCLCSLCKGWAMSAKPQTKRR